MKSNPFESPAASADLPVSDSEPKALSVPVILLHLARLLLVCCIFIFAPLFVAPFCFDLYEEFGFDLAAITKAYLAACSLLQNYFWILTPLTFAIAIGLEIAIHKIPQRFTRMVVSLLYWLLLIFLLVASVTALWVPYQNVVAGLNA